MTSQRRNSAVSMQHSAMLLLLWQLSAAFTVMVMYNMYNSAKWILELAGYVLYGYVL